MRVDARFRHDPARVRVLIDEILDSGVRLQLLADRLDVSRRYLSMIRNGHFDNPSYLLQVGLELIAREEG